MFYYWCKNDVGNQRLLAEKLGVSFSFVSNIVQGRKQIPIERLKEISEITGIKAKDLRPDIYEIFKADIR